MNVHDSERLAGLLEDAGYVPADGGGDARRRRAQHLRGPGERRQQAVRQPRPPAARPSSRTRACRSRSAAASRRRTAARSSSGRRGWTSCSARTTSASLPVLLERARHNDEAQVEILESLEVFPSTLPARRESAYAGWVSISVGCNNTCTFCIVPVAARQGEGPPPRRGARRGRGAGRRGRARGDAARAERELLRRRVRRPAARSASCCAPAAAIDGLERVRFTSPHPQGLHRRRDRRDGRDAERLPPAAHAAAVRAPTACCKAMRRSYRSARYLAIIDKVRAAMPDAAITTDIIVGFPGETEDDFAADPATSCARRGSPARSRSSTRSAPARPAATLPDQLPKAVVQERFERLIARAGGDLLGAEPGAGRRDGRGAGADGRGPQGRATRARLSGRGPRRPAGALRAGRRARSGPATWSRPSITYAAPHHLVADGAAGLAPPDAGGRQLRRGRAAAHRPGSGWACRRSGAPAAERGTGGWMRSHMTDEPGPPTTATWRACGTRSTGSSGTPSAGPPGRWSSAGARWSSRSRCSC